MLVFSTTKVSIASIRCALTIWTIQNNSSSSNNNVSTMKISLSPLITVLALVNVASADPSGKGGKGKKAQFSNAPSLTPTEIFSPSPTASMAPSIVPSFSHEPTLSVGPSAVPSDAPSDVPSSVPSCAYVGGSSKSKKSGKAGKSGKSGKGYSYSPTLSSSTSAAPSGSVAPSAAPSWSPAPSFCNEKKPLKKRKGSGKKSRKSIKSGKSGKGYDDKSVTANETALSAVEMSDSVNSGAITHDYLLGSVVGAMPVLAALFLL